MMYLSYSTSNKILLSVLFVALASCSKPVTPSAKKDVPTTFASPSDAGAALLAAAQSGDRSAMLAIFGPDGQDVLFVGDTAQDAANLRAFVEAYTRMNRWENIKAGGKVLYVGADNSAFPVPLGQNASGRWYFDTAAGKDEIRARTIGKNELTAIAVSEATANAQNRYFSQTHLRGQAREYAGKLVSDPGKQNGLYWPVAEGHAPSPLGEFGDFTKAVASNTGDRPPLFNGYYYRVLTKPGDFTVLAYPAEYRNSGIMTFLVGKDGFVYQKDLGEKTGDVALAMAEVNPADGWSPTAEHTGTASRSR
jgi:Protein of unknown function (DUF2950)